MRWIYGSILLIWCSSFYEPSPTLYKATTSEVTCIAWTIYQEARSEDNRGRRAIYDVLLERSKRNNKSICHVIAERGQFATYRKNRKVTQEMLDMYAQAVTMLPVAQGSTHFYSGKMPTYVRKSRNEFVSVEVIGKHVFLKQII